MHTYETLNNTCGSASEQHAPIVERIKSTDTMHSSHCNATNCERELEADESDGTCNESFGEHVMRRSLSPSFPGCPKMSLSLQFRFCKTDRDTKRTRAYGGEANRTPSTETYIRRCGTSKTQQCVINHTSILSFATCLHSLHPWGHCMTSACLKIVRCRPEGGHVCAISRFLYHRSAVSSSSLLKLFQAETVVSGYEQPTLFGALHNVRPTLHKAGEAKQIIEQNNL